MLRPNAAPFKLLALAIVLSWTSYVLAEEASGTVKSVDTSKQQLVLKGAIKDATYDVTKDAAIFLDGSKAKLGDFKEGDKVQVAFEKSGDQMKASAIRGLRNASETTGAIKEVFTEKREVILKGVVKDTIYELNKDGAVWIDNRPAQLKDLRAGDRVRITFQARGDRNQASEIARMPNP